MIQGMNQKDQYTGQGKFQGWSPAKGLEARCKYRVKVRVLKTPPCGV